MSSSLVSLDFVLVDANQDLDVQNPENDYLVFLEEGAEYDLEALRSTYGTQDFALLCITDPVPFSVDELKEYRQPFLAYVISICRQALPCAA